MPVSTPARTSPRVPLRPASLLDLDQELADALEPAERGPARNALAVAVADVPQGRWDLDTLGDFRERASGLLVCDGLLIRDVLLAGNASSELLGAGDIVSHHDAADALLP